MMVEEIKMLIINGILSKFWKQDKKEALLKVLYEIYNCDKVFTIEEANDFNKKCKKLNIDSQNMKAISIKKAITIIQNDKLLNDLLYFIIASAVYKDKDYDQQERSQIDEIIKKYNLNEKILIERIKEIRNKNIKKLLNEWEKEIQDGKYP
ncbi:MAG: hypothetical protein A2161_10640 [Candidatus Schekmanbacteria bacterium RBG_13_48_7]|uniref:Uncharacterized protein n=1 Tax=Candidatus Schekmanbacteria bacterium RBG_13_48_7 TaxID=1817878 RepID=A0A1F7RUS4_9BACT|nr:MAG: hypothetical protein A2161_10640 [Candidatus Schekmanbacteria bacterium RBG_13_48_7]